MNEIINYLGKFSLQIILEQERKHWLLHTWKKNTVQDKRTGDTFIGIIDNKGSHVDISSSKLGRHYNIIENTTFIDSEMNNVLTTDLSSFPYTNGMDGALIERIISSQYVVSSDSRQHFSIKFTNCEEVIIPFAGSTESSDVYPFRWIRTTTVPTMVLGNGSERTCTVMGASNNVYYYPLDSSLQPLPLTNPSTGTYQTAMVSSDAYIGYPIYWFTCDEFKEVNRITSTDDYFIPGNQGGSTMNDVYLYTGFKTPGGSISDYKILVHGTGFEDSAADFNKPLETTIIIQNINTTAETEVVLSSDTEFKLTMIRNIGWTYVNSSTYEISLAVFDNDGVAPLIPALSADVNITDTTNLNTSDAGSTGVYLYSDLHENSDNDYINGLFDFDGLPDHLTANKKETVIMYAVHDTPDAASPKDKQTAAIILDPGIIQNVDPEDETSDTYMNGRAYIISNDDAVYENNATTDFPKPARTAARICDIPTSIVQLTNITGLAPTEVVDKKYVRSECSYTENDKDRLYNTLTTRWVRPIHLNSSGVPIKDTDLNEDDNQFVFRNFNALTAVDLINHNDFRYLIQLNPVVDPYNVGLNAIVDRGSGYSKNDTGIIIVGGYSFTYTVTDVNSTGGVLNAVLGTDGSEEINLSNFDFGDHRDNGITIAYGTSPLSGEGTGLRISFVITNYQDILTKKDEIYTDLFALCCDGDGLWLYSYNINTRSTSTPKLGFWEKVIKISDYEDSEINTAKGNISLSDAYISSVLPSNHEVSVCVHTPNQEPVNINALTTASFINVVDKTHSPLVNGSNPIDMNKFISDGIHTGTAIQKRFESLIYVLRQENKLSFDSYLLWRWESTSDIHNLRFEYCILRRSFNNYLSTDDISLLPDNNLKYKKFVHSNNGTTVSWNIDMIGTMVWVYNPDYTILEKYSTNEVGKLHIDYVKSTWKNVEIINGTGLEIVDEYDRLLWNIATNNPQQTNYIPEQDAPIYQQPEFTNFSDCVIGTNVNTIIPNHNPMGMWTLIYPRTQTFTLKSNDIESAVELIPMHVIRTSNIAQNAQIKDSNNNDITDYTVTLDQSSSGLSFKAYDKHTGTWKQI